MTVVWMELADMRLTEIFDYLKEVAGVRTAQKITGNIGAKTRILVTNPRAGQREEVLHNRIEEFRYLVEGNYKIIYFVADEKIIIATIFDCRRDPSRLQDEVSKNPNDL